MKGVVPDFRKYVAERHTNPDRRQSDNKFVQWNYFLHWSMVSPGNNSLYEKCVFQKNQFLEKNTTMKNREMSFLIKRASNTKTVKILAYCVLQVGKYEARAHQK